MNVILKFFTGTVIKKIAEKYLRRKIKQSDNLIDDSLLSIKDKIDSGNFDITDELDTLQKEAIRLWDEHQAKKVKDNKDEQPKV